MHRTFRKAALSAGLFLALAAGQVTAQEQGTPAAPAASPPDYYLPVASWARPTNTPSYNGYYVGGGAAVRGDGRYLTEGTWGWDYEGDWFRRHVWLNWYHGRHYQGGTGSYSTGLR